MGFIVERRSFYKNENSRLLKYFESSPEVECKDGDCNCTASIKSRPSGVLDHVVQNIRYTGIYSGYNLDWSLNRDTWFDLNFYWNEIKRPKNQRYLNPHASFCFNHVSSAGGKLNNSISIGICKTPASSFKDLKIDLIANMYFGNKVDVSKLFNGHSSSKIVDLTKLSQEDVWLHYSIGGEAMEVLPRSEESTMWKQIYKNASRVMEITSQHDDKEMSVLDVRCDIVTNFELIGLIDGLKAKLTYVIDNLEDTQLYQLGTKIEEKVKANW